MHTYHLLHGIAQQKVWTRSSFEFTHPGLKSNFTVITGCRLLRWLDVRVVCGLKAAPHCENEDEMQNLPLAMHLHLVFGGSYQYLLKEQKTKIPKISTEKRSDDQVVTWTEARPVGAVSLYVDDTLVGAHNSRQGKPNSRRVDQ
eukprot:485842-Amphidinium_carterae.2